MKDLVVLSLFDGMGGGRIALDKLGITPKKYFASEIKKHAIKCATTNYPDIIEIGDVTKVKYEDNKLYNDKGEVVYEGHIDLLIGGSPCQDFSIANLQNKKNDNYLTYGLKGSKSKLFYEYLRLKKEIAPTYFLLENVHMRESSERQLNSYLGVKGLHINSNLVSYQDRKRIYWTNIPNVTIPADREIDFQDYIDTDVSRLEEAKVNPTPCRIRMWNDGNGKQNGLIHCDNITNKHKIHTLTRKQDRSPNSGLIEYKDFCRFLTRRELEGAQTVPYGYTDCVSYLQAQDLLGDGWTIDVIAHILQNIKDE